MLALIFGKDILRRRRQNAIGSMDDGSFCEVAGIDKFLVGQLSKFE